MKIVSDVESVFMSRHPLNSTCLTVLLFSYTDVIMILQDELSSYAWYFMTWTSPAKKAHIEYDAAMGVVHIWRRWPQLETLPDLTTTASRICLLSNLHSHHRTPVPASLIRDDWSKPTSHILYLCTKWILIYMIAICGKFINSCEIKTGLIYEF